MKKEPFKEWTIYLWQDGSKVYAASKVKGQVYGYGWKIEQDKERKEDTPKKILYQAKRNAVTNVNNTLNVLDMYGTKVVDSDGNIDPEKVSEQERIHAYYGALRKTRKFPIIEITNKEAFSYKLT